MRQFNESTELEEREYVFEVIFCAKERTSDNYRIWKFKEVESGIPVNMNMFPNVENLLLPALGCKEIEKNGKKGFDWDNEEVVSMKLKFVAECYLDKAGYKKLRNFKQEMNELDKVLNR